MQRLNLPGAAQKGAFRIAAAIIEVDDIIERGGLTVAEIRSGFRDLAQALGAPHARRNGLAAEVAVAGGWRIIAEMPIYIEVPIGDLGPADQLLVRRAPGLRGIGMGRKAGINMQADDVEIIVGK